MVRCSPLFDKERDLAGVPTHEDSDVSGSRWSLRFRGAQSNVGQC